MDVRGTLLKQPSDNIRSCSGRICPRPKQLSSARNCSASCSRTANPANHATALHSVNLCIFLQLQPWRQNVELQYKTHLSCFSFSFMLHSGLPTYGRLKYFILLTITVLCVLQCILFPWIIIKCTSHTSNTTHDVWPFCKHLKALSPVNVDRSSLISAFCYVALYPLHVYIKILYL